MISSIIIAACSIATIMLVWFKSDAFLEYAKLFGLKEFVKYSEYKSAMFDNPTLSYPLFLKTREWESKYTEFFFKLIGCRLCTSIWLSAIFSLFFMSSVVSFFGYTSLLTIFSLFIVGNITKLLDENK